MCASVRGECANMVANFPKRAIKQEEEGSSAVVTGKSGDVDFKAAPKCRSLRVAECIRRHGVQSTATGTRSFSAGSLSNR